MEELFASYDLSQQLKKRGFNEPCIGFWRLIDSEPVFNITSNYKYSTSQKQVRYIQGDTAILAPLYQQITDWLRDKYEIHIEIELVDTTTEFYYFYAIINSKDREYNDLDMTDQAKRIYNWDKATKYSDVLKAAIDDALKLI